MMSGADQGPLESGLCNHLFPFPIPWHSAQVASLIFTIYLSVCVCLSVYLSIYIYRFFFFFWLFLFIGKVPGFWAGPTPQQGAFGLVGQCQVLNSLCHRGTPPSTLLITKSKERNKDRDKGSSCRGSAVTNLTRIHEDTDSIPDLARWVKDLALP